MASVQGSLFTELDGFRYQPDLLDHSEEEVLLRHLRALPFREFDGKTFQRFTAFP